MAATGLNPILRRLFRAPVYIYRLQCGWLLGHRFLLLIHIGRRTRRRRYTVLEVMEFNGTIPEMVVMSGFGRDADWLRNIEVTPGPEVIVGKQRFVSDHRVLTTHEAVRVIAKFEQRNRLFASVIRTVLSRLLGWRYDSSEEARCRLAAQLPLIAFRPKTHGPPQDCAG